jgi:multidrug efflux pump subunit AcrB
MPIDLHQLGRRRRCSSRRRPAGGAAGGGIAVIYTLLGVLYESYIHPLTILAGLPSAAIARC